MYYESIFGVDNSSSFFTSQRRTGIFEWAEQPRQSTPIYPPSVFTAGEDYMPAYPDLDISSYNELSCNYSPPPSYRESPRPVYVSLPENANESLSWGSPIPVSPGGAPSELNATLSRGTPIRVSSACDREPIAPRVWRPWDSPV